jgi:hypothetical protein
LECCQVHERCENWAIPIFHSLTASPLPPRRGHHCRLICGQRHQPEYCPLQFPPRSVRQPLAVSPWSACDRIQSGTRRRFPHRPQVRGCRTHDSYERLDNEHEDHDSEDGLTCLWHYPTPQIGERLQKPIQRKSESLTSQVALGVAPFRVCYETAHSGTYGRRNRET